MGGTSARWLWLFLLGALTACGHHSSTEPAPQPCTYTVTVSPASFTAAGGTGSATVATAAGCAWTARADVGWLTVTGAASGTGAGQVLFAVSANAEAAGRAGTLVIAGQSLTVQQDAAAVSCTYALAPGSASMNKDGGTGTFSVTAGSACAWTAESDASWLTVTSGSQGAGSGVVAYSVPRNTTTSGRSASIRVAGQRFSLTQSGDLGACQYSVAPIEFSPCMGSVELSSQLVTLAECPWTAAPGASWIALASGESGAGSGTVRFRVSDNYDAPRSGVVMIRWPTATAGQNLQIAQAGCRYGLSANTFAFSAAGGSGTVDVLQQSDPQSCGGALQDRCVWSARSDAAWIAVTTAMPRSGDNPFSFTVAANDGAARSGTITVRNQTVRVTQAGR